MLVVIGANTYLNTPPTRKKRKEKERRGEEN
jgi:hypothetical protein